MRLVGLGHRGEQLHEGGWRVEADGVADPIGLAGVVREDERHPFVGVGLAPEGGEPLLNLVTAEAWREN